MNFYSIIFLIIFSVILIIPLANAQVLNDEIKQKSIEVIINSKGEVHVTHIIDDLNLPLQLDLIDGIITNLSVKDKDGKDLQYGEMTNNEALMVFPSKQDTIIEYDLANVLILRDNVWTWEFIYLDSVSFILPEEVDLISVNGGPTFLGETNGIKCHGCQMILEYSLDEPKIFQSVKINDFKFLIEIITWAKISQFNFDPKSSEMSFEISDNNDFVTIIIPVGLLLGPYQAFLDEEKIFFQESSNNGTHVWINMRPQNSGEVSIMGSLVPDSGEFKIDSENEFPVENVVVGMVIVSVVIIGVFLLKRKKNKI